MRFIKDCLDSIMRQTVWVKKDFDIKIAINIVDNGSQDGTVEYIRKNYPYVHILQNVNNLGFSRAYNQAIQMHNTDYVLIMNIDVILEKDFLEKIFAVVLRDKDEIGTWGGKIFKAQTQIDEDGLPKLIKTNIFDSCGLEIKKSRRLKNIGEGENESGYYDNLAEVFGFSGCCTLFRREALESAKFKNEYYDEDFFAYQEDYDLAYRLQLLGWRAKFVAGAKAYHFRSAQLSFLNPFKFWKVIQARRAKSQMINYHSYKNHWFVLLKNELTQNFLYHLPYIVWFEFKKLIYILLFEQKTLGSLKDFFKKFRKMKIKRQVIQERRKVSAAYLRAFFN